MKTDICSFICIFIHFSSIKYLKARKSLKISWLSMLNSYVHLIIVLTFTFKTLETLWKDTLENLKLNVSGNPEHTQLVLSCSKSTMQIMCEIWSKLIIKTPE